MNSLILAFELLLLVIVTPIFVLGFLLFIASRVLLVISFNCVEALLTLALDLNKNRKDGE